MVYSNSQLSYILINKLVQQIFKYVRKNKLEKKSGFQDDH